MDRPKSAEGAAMLNSLRELRDGATPAAGPAMCHPRSGLRGRTRVRSKSMNLGPARPSESLQGLPRRQQQHQQSTTQHNRSRKVRAAADGDLRKEAEDAGWGTEKEDKGQVERKPKLRRALSATAGQAKAPGDQLLTSPETRLTPSSRPVAPQDVGISLTLPRACSRGRPSAPTEHHGGAGDAVDGQGGQGERVQEQKERGYSGPLLRQLMDKGSFQLSGRPLGRSASLISSERLRISSPLGWGKSGRRTMEVSLTPSLSAAASPAQCSSSSSGRPKSFSCAAPAAPSSSTQGDSSSSSPGNSNSNTPGTSSGNTSDTSLSNTSGISSSNTSDTSSSSPPGGLEQSPGLRVSHSNGCDAIGSAEEGYQKAALSGPLTLHGVPAPGPTHGAPDEVQTDLLSYSDVFSYSTILALSLKLRPNQASKLHSAMLASKDSSGSFQLDLVGPSGAEGPGVGAEVEKGLRLERKKGLSFGGEQECLGVRKGGGRVLPDVDGASQGLQEAVHDVHETEARGDGGRVALKGGMAAEGGGCEQLPGQPREQPKEQVMGRRPGEGRGRSESVGRFRRGTASGPLRTMTWGAEAEARGGHPARVSKEEHHGCTQRKPKDQASDGAREKPVLHKERVTAKKRVTACPSEGCQRGPGAMNGKLSLGEKTWGAKRTLLGMILTRKESLLKREGAVSREEAHPKEEEQCSDRERRRRVPIRRTVTESSADNGGEEVVYLKGSMPRARAAQAAASATARKGPGSPGAHDSSKPSRPPGSQAHGKVNGDGGGIEATVRRHLTMFFPSGARTVTQVHHAAEAEALPKPRFRRQKGASLLDRYKLGCVIGEGGFGVVRCCVSLSTGQKYACKMVNWDRLPRPVDVKRVYREYAIQSRLSDHKNILGAVEMFEAEEGMAIVMEYCPDGDLFDLIKQVGVLTEQDAKALFLQVLRAVQHCHEHKVVHRDIKLENVLVTRLEWAKESQLSGAPQKSFKKLPTLKLGDFGAALSLPPGRKTRGRSGGSLMYQAPEVLRSEEYDHKADMWSLGVVLFAMLSSSFPFGAPLENLLVGMIKRAVYEMTGPKWENVSEPAKEVVGSLLQQDPARRPTVTQILNHPWFHEKS